MTPTTCDRHLRVRADGTGSAADVRRVGGALVWCWHDEDPRTVSRPVEDDGMWRGAVMTWTEQCEARERIMFSARTCWTCIHENNGWCKVSEEDVAVSNWACDWCAEDGAPVADAPPCPGWRGAK